MRVLYLLPGSHLFGGVKVVLQHVRGLRGLGVEALAVSPEPVPTWFDGAAELYRQVDDFSAASLGCCDIVVATFWTTARPALAVAGARAFHLCQGYEALHVAEGSPLREQVEEVYRLPTHKLAVSPHLVELLEGEYGVEVDYVPQPFRPDLFHPPPSRREASDLRCLLVGSFGEEVKGVAWALGELAPLFEDDRRWRLVRVSQDEDPEELRDGPPAERHTCVLPRDMPELVRSCDLFLAANRAHEGFGLPALEAFGCGLPGVVSDTPAHRCLDPEGEASLRFSLDEGEGLRAGLRRLGLDRELRASLGRAARRIAETYDEARTAARLVDCFGRAAAAQPSVR